MSAGNEMSETTIVLHDYEVEQLIAWHREEQWRNANNEEYSEADDHKNRHSEWCKELKRRTNPTPTEAS